MPTRRGWEALAGGVALIVLGRILGLPSLYVVGTAGIVLVLAALAWVRLHRFELDATRQVQPARVELGSAARIELTVRNAGRRRSPVLMVTDPFDGGQREARFLLSSLPAGEEGRAAYRLPTERRGVFSLGPLELELRDPFGLATVSVEAAATSRITVLPKVERIPAPPPGTGTQPESGVDRPSFRGQRGEDFYALRPYAVGDELRRVHWPSTARLDELMIRQDERPRQDRVTVLLDRRAAVHDRTTVELAVSAAASVVVATASAAQRAQVRLVDTSGTDSGYGVGPHHANLVLDRLAELTADGDAASSPGLTRLRSGAGGGTLVAVTTQVAADAELEELTRLQPRFSPLLMVVVDGPAGHPAVPAWPGAPGAGSVGDSGRAGQRPAWGGGTTRLVRTGPGRPFAKAWAAAVAGRTPRTVGAGPRRRPQGLRG